MTEKDPQSTPKERDCEENLHTFAGWLARQYLEAWRARHRRWSSVLGSLFPLSRRRLRSSPKTRQECHSQGAYSSQPGPSAPRNTWAQFPSRNREFSFVKIMLIKIASRLWKGPIDYLCKYLDIFIYMCIHIYIMNVPFSLFTPYCLTMWSHKTRCLLGFSIQDAPAGDWRGREGREVELTPSPISCQCGCRGFPLWQPSPCSPSALLLWVLLTAPCSQLFRLHGGIVPSLRDSVLFPWNFPISCPHLIPLLNSRKLPTFECIICFLLRPFLIMLLKVITCTENTSTWYLQTAESECIWALSKPVAESDTSLLLRGPVVSVE